MYRQGDILLVAAHHVPSGAREQESCVLAEGEATGHAHRILDGAALWMDAGGSRYVEVMGQAAVLVHEEHRPITLPGPAVYRVIRQREYTVWQARYAAD